jgi:uncharacterized membrane protein
MEVLGKLSREVQIILAAALLYVIFSFFDWQQVSISGIGTAGISEWHGVGVIAALLAIALLVWEGARIFLGDIDLGPLSAGLISVGLAMLLLLFTIITFLTHNEFRHWPSWLGLVLSILIGVLAFRRAQTEGVQMPDMSAVQTRTQSRTNASTTPPPAATDTPPPAETTAPPPSSPSGDAPSGT